MADWCRPKVMVACKYPTDAALRNDGRFEIGGKIALVMALPTLTDIYFLAHLWRANHVFWTNLTLVFGPQIVDDPRRRVGVKLDQAASTKFLHLGTVATGHHHRQHEAVRDLIKETITADRRTIAPAAALAVTLGALPGEIIATVAMATGDGTPARQSRRVIFMRPNETRQYRSAPAWVKSAVPFWPVKFPFICTAGSTVRHHLPDKPVGGVRQETFRGYRRANIS